jgi:chemotaxis protein CheZ
MASAATQAFGALSEEPVTAGVFDVRSVVRELSAVADYIRHIKREIGALQANELYRDRIPRVHEDLGSVVRATASATNAIMGAAEDILGSEEASIERYRERVQSKLVEIFEACAFQDITGQRIARALDALGYLEKRLGRFASAVNARDSEPAPDPEEALRQARRELLLLNGPQDDGLGAAQDDIDQMFV